MKTLCALLTSTLILASCTANEQIPATDPIVDNELSFMFGEWVGVAEGTSPTGQPYKVTQTERVGPMLDGDITVIEGRGYDQAGKVAFNAFAVVSKDKRTDQWEIRSYSAGYSGTFPFEITDDGYVWETPAGPNAVMQHSATIKDGTWTSKSQYIPSEGPARITNEMSLKRINSTSWPNEGYVRPNAGSE